MSFIFNFRTKKILKVNKTHFKGLNSGKLLEIDDSSSNLHQHFYPIVVSSSGNIHTYKDFPT